MAKERTLLFADILGLKSLWSERGLAAAERRLNLFERLIDSAIADATKGGRKVDVSGEIESDAVMLTFTDVADAIVTGAALWRRAFVENHGDGSDQRLYLRGLITRIEPTTQLRQMLSTTTRPKIRRAKYAGGLLDGVFLEKSGYKGMRLIIDRELASNDVRNKAEVTYRNLFIDTTSPAGQLPIAAAIGAPYPKGRRMADVFWPLSNKREFGRLRQRLDRRLKDLAGGREEKEHATGTASLFAEIAKRLNDASKKT